MPNCKKTCNGRAEFREGRVIALWPEAATDRAIAADGGDAREAVKALIMASNFHETNSLKAHGGLDRPCIPLSLARKGVARSVQRGAR
jgi:hypothetical protein